tara:strand:- start:2797 stop:3126 length:330 start_codon:yes stop_codon:yes gene_type:complete
MTLQEKYIYKISSELGIVAATYGGNNSYSFPCPFCSHLPTKTGKIKLKKRTAGFITDQNCKYEYNFFCNRQGSNSCKGAGKKGGMGFLNFLFRYRPYLAEKYKFEKANT